METKRMGVIRPKAKTDQTTEARLSEARAELARIEAAIGGADREIDLQILDGDQDAVRQAEAAAAGLQKDRERAARRVVLLEQKAAAEQTARQERAQADLIGRSAEHFRERDEAAVEMVTHMEGMVAAYRKAMKAGAAAVTGWPFGPGDSAAAMIGRPFIHAITAELYRLSGDDMGREPAFPGAQCPDIRDARPLSVKPLAAKVAEATAYALRVMRESPVRVLPIATPPMAPAQPIAPAASPESPAAIRPAEPATPKEARAVEFAWLVDLVEMATGRRQTERILFTPDQADECHLDGLGPTGPRGREMALRLASASAREGVQVDGRSLRFDMAALARSIEDN
jgi:hypothetical protein